MTDPISNAPRLVQTDPASRKSTQQAAPGAGEVAALPASQADEAARKSAGAAQGADSVGFKAVQERLRQEPDFDQAKVDAIKQALQNGQYPLNPRRIAECFVALEQLISD